MSEPKKVVGECPVCGGDIFSTQERVAAPPGLFGSENQSRGSQIRESYHCETCGVKFEFPTPPAVSEAAKRAREANAANAIALKKMLDDGQ